MAHSRHSLVTIGTGAPASGAYSSVPTGAAAEVSSGVSTEWTPAPSPWYQELIFYIPAITTALDVAFFLAVVWPNMFGKHDISLSHWLIYSAAHCFANFMPFFTAWICSITKTDDMYAAAHYEPFMTHGVACTLFGLAYCISYIWLWAKTRAEDIDAFNDPAGVVFPLASTVSMFLSLFYMTGWIVKVVLLAPCVFEFRRPHYGKEGQKVVDSNARLTEGRRSAKKTVI